MAWLPLNLAAVTLEDANIDVCCEELAMYPLARSKAAVPDSQQMDDGNIIWTLVWGSFLHTPGRVSASRRRLRVRCTPE